MWSCMFFSMHVLLWVFLGIPASSHTINMFYRSFGDFKLSLRCECVCLWLSYGPESSPGCIPPSPWSSWKMKSPSWLQRQQSMVRNLTMFHPSGIKSMQLESCRSRNQEHEDSSLDFSTPPDIPVAPSLVDPCSFTCLSLQPIYWFVFWSDR